MATQNVAAPVDADQREVAGIEVTDDMIEAGARLLDLFTAQDLADGSARPAEIAEAIFRTMLLASCSKRLSRCGQL